MYVKDFLPGYQGGLIANGIHRYSPSLAKGDLARGAEIYDNLTASGSPAVRVRSAGKPGAVVIPMISPYVYLGGQVKLVATGRSARDRLSVSISTNNGRTYAPIYSASLVKRTEATVDLKDKIFRRYAFWLRIELTTAAGLERFEVDCDFQHAPRTLPWLAKGNNTITVAVDSNRAIATRTISCRITPDAAFTKNETAGTMGIGFDNVDLRYDACWWKGGTGFMTVPVDVPGDLAAMGFSAQIRARSEKDQIRVTASTDKGRSWRDVALISGPTPGRTEHFRVNKWPPGTRKVLLRFAMTGNNTVGVMSFRVDADYHDPMAAKALVRSASFTGGPRQGSRAPTPRRSRGCRPGTRSQPPPIPTWSRSPMRWRKAGETKGRD